MNGRRSLLVRIFFAAVFIFASAAPGIAGDFPIRPAGAPIRYFTGVLMDFSVGNDIGAFTLKIGKKTIAFGVGGALLINHKDFHCIDLMR
jgi:hypothetical protein